MKYIYFEIHTNDAQCAHIHNENIQYLKPVTNSVGYCRNVTNLNNSNNKVLKHIFVEQIWIDLTKYKSDDVSEYLDKYIQECLHNIKIKLRELKLNKILYEI